MTISGPENFRELLRKHQVHLSSESQKETLGDAEKKEKATSTDEKEEKDKMRISNSKAVQVEKEKKLLSTGVQCSLIQWSSRASCTSFTLGTFLRTNSCSTDNSEFRPRSSKGHFFYKSH